MSRGLNRSLLVAGVAAALLTHLQAANPPSTLERFLSLSDPDPREYRALRHLEAHNGQFDKSATMDVWTEGDANGFRYRIVSEEGSEYIRSRVFRQTLETERAMWASGAPDRAGFTQLNYVFEDTGIQPDGSTSLRLKPRRKDVLLVDGTIFLNPEDGDLIRMEGKLSKTPSFWTRHVQITRWYKRFAGIRMPVALESTANVRIAGKSTFRMTYEYESINGMPVR
jgi:hypothetical protein